MLSFWSHFLNFFSLIRFWVTCKCCRTARGGPLQPASWQAGPPLRVLSHRRFETEASSNETGWANVQECQYSSTILALNHRCLTEWVASFFGTLCGLSKIRAIRQRRHHCIPELCVETLYLSTYLQRQAKTNSPWTLCRIACFLNCKKAWWWYTPKNEPRPAYPQDWNTSLRLKLNPNDWNTSLKLITVLNRQFQQYSTIPVTKVYSSSNRSLRSRPWHLWIVSEYLLFALEQMHSEVLTDQLLQSWPIVALSFLRVWQFLFHVP